MIAAVLLRCVWLFLPLTLSHASTDSFSVVVPKTPIKGMLGASVSLPCTLSTNLDVRTFDVRWYRPSMYNRPALWYNNEKIVETPTDEQYQGRVSLVGALEKGEVSLKLDNLKPADSGAYICHVSSDKWYDKSNTSLIIQAVGSSPVLSVADAEEGQVKVSCHSHGWTPKPSLTWRHKDGRNLNHLIKGNSFEVSEGLFSVSSWLLVSPSESNWISCSVALPDSNGEMRESRVMPHIQTESWKGAFIVTLVLLLLCIIGVGVYCVLQRKGLIGSKRKKTKGREKTHTQNDVENLQLLQPQTAETPNQPVLIGANHYDDPQTNMNSSPTAETQTLNDVEKQQLLEPQTAGTPHQPEFIEPQTLNDVEKQQLLNERQTAGTAHQPEFIEPQTLNDVKKQQLLNERQTAGTADQPGFIEANPDQDPELNVNSSPAAGANHDQDPGPNVILPPAAAEWDQVKKLGKKVNITIDPEETPQFFRIAQGQKRVICPRPKEDHEDEECKIFSLCKEKFSSGQQYWEVKVCKTPKEKLSWFVGVASEEAENMLRIPLTPQNGFWVLCYEKEKGVYVRDSPVPTPLPDVSDELTTVGVFLDCDKHTLSFYSVHTQSLIYTFTSVTSKTSLRPLISPGIRDSHPVHIC